MSLLGSGYDLVVIGGGPGGYPAAVRSAQLGMRTLLVDEREGLGGECTLYGCIPTKTLIKISRGFHEVYREGLVRGSIEIDFTRALERAREISSKISSGIRDLLRSYGVDIVRGRARLLERDRVYIEGWGEARAPRVIIATGTDPVYPSGLEADGVSIHDNRTILGLRKRPSSIVVVGGGYVGVEFATVFSRIGVETSIVEMMPSLLPGIDRDASRLVEKRLSETGVKIFKSSTVREVYKREGGVELVLTGGVRVYGEVVLVATGRRPRTSDIGLENTGVERDERGYIRVDPHMRTSVPGVYASGDVTGPPLLAHKAFIQAVVAAETAAGLESVYDRKAVPSIVFSDPEIVQVGYSVEEARARGHDPVSVRLFAGGVARAVVEGCEECFIKIVYDRGSRRVLGIVIAAPGASELAGEASLAIETGMRVEDLSRATHPHPTISELFKEIVDYIEGRSTHYYIKRGAR